jgi:hypothetical protein
LFQKWYQDYAWGEIQKHDGKIENPDALPEYVSLLINTTNPYAELIIEAFAFSIDSDK